MDRRSFFKAAAVGIPMVTLSSGGECRSIPAMPPVGFRRVSVREGDPGERLYAMSLSDNLKIKIYLDDVEQRCCITADEAAGFVIRHVQTSKGNLAVNYATNKVLEETVSGRVRVEISNG